MILKRISQIPWNIVNPVIFGILSWKKYCSAGDAEYSKVICTDAVERVQKGVSAN